MPNNNIISNHLVVLREEFDDWAILFDPDSGEGYGLNPVSVFIWKCLDGKHTPRKISEELRKNFKNIPNDVEIHINNFIQDLIKNGLAGQEL
jgi:SynChlorMet cassette protein ScmD